MFLGFLIIILKDDAKGDPQWSMEQILAAEYKFGDFVIGREEYEIMARTTIVVFEVNIMNTDLKKENVYIYYNFLLMLPSMDISTQLSG